MAGSPPPPDAPSPDERKASTVEAGFKPGPPVGDLCGFKIPSFTFSLGFNLPSLSFPPPFPRLTASLGLNCDLSNPVNVSAGISFGGGRKPTGNPDSEDT
jgi:hypothetical protein